MNHDTRPVCVGVTPTVRSNQEARARHEAFCRRLSIVSCSTGTFVVLIPTTPLSRFSNPLQGPLSKKLRGSVQVRSDYASPLWTSCHNCTLP